jgi:hypothetical protein
MGIAVAVVLLILTAPSAALADPRPKPPKGIEESPAVIEDANAEVVDPIVGVEGTGEVTDASVDGGPATPDTGRREKPADSKDEAKDTKIKPAEKEKTIKPNDAAAAAVDPKDSKAGCKNQCQESAPAEGQATSMGVISEAGGTAGVVFPNAATVSSSDGGSRASPSRLIPARGSGVGGSSAGRRFSVNGAGLVAAGAQPSLAIVVDALNDADGDGIYSDSETAVESGADVGFKAIITNMGATAFEIANVTQSFIQESSRVQVEVCGDLKGLTLGFGESLACSFSVADYAPPVGKTVVNTVTASAIEIAGSKRRGTSDSDNTTVVTFLEDQVLAVAIERAPGALAFTGTGAARLLAVALLLLVAGGTALFLSRAREGRPPRPTLRLGPWPRGSRRPEALVPPPERTAGRSAPSA